MTQICVERCAEDGVTCDTEMELDMCSCKGRTLSTRETIQFDMERYVMMRYSCMEVKKGDG